MSDDREAQRELQAAVNAMGVVLARNRALEEELRGVRSTLKVIMKGISPDSYYVQYTSAKPQSFLDLCKEVVNKITARLGE